MHAKQQDSDKELVVKVQQPLEQQAEKLTEIGRLLFSIPWTSPSRLAHAAGQTLKGEYQNCSSDQQQGMQDLRNYMLKGRQQKTEFTRAPRTSPVA